MFNDLSSAWPISIPSINRVANAGLLTGDPDGNFRPTDPLTRQEIALILDRLLLMENKIEDDARIALLQKVADSVVQVSTSSGLGSGVVIDNDPGYVLTNHHVVTNKDGTPATNIQITWTSPYRSKSKNLPDFIGPAATIVATDPERDLALLSFFAPRSTPVEIDPTWAVPAAQLNAAGFVGRRVYIQGSPLGDGGRLSEGIFNGMNGKYFDMDIHINPGNSGGPIFDRDGQMVGLVCAKIVNEAIEGFGYGIPLIDIVDFLAQNGL